MLQRSSEVSKLNILVNKSEKDPLKTTGQSKNLNRLNSSDRPTFSSTSEQIFIEALCYTLWWRPRRLKMGNSEHYIWILIHVSIKTCVSASDVRTTCSSNEDTHVSAFYNGNIFYENTLRNKRENKEDCMVYITVLLWPPHVAYGKRQLAYRAFGTQGWMAQYYTLLKTPTWNIY
jgi:hypothetical protein